MKDLSRILKSHLNLNPHMPVAQKVADEVVFRRFQGEEVEFFLKSDLTDESALIRNFLRSGRARGETIGRVRVEYKRLLTLYYRNI